MIKFLRIVPRIHYIPRYYNMSPIAPTPEI